MIEVSIFQGTILSAPRQTIFVFVGRSDAYLLANGESGVPRLAPVARIDLRSFPRRVKDEPALVIQAAGGERFTMSELSLHSRYYARNKTWLAKAPGDNGWTIYGQAPGCGPWVTGRRVEEFELDAERRLVAVTRTPGGTPERQEFDWLFNYATGEMLYAPAGWHRE